MGSDAKRLRLWMIGIDALVANLLGVGRRYEFE